jgi:hypothetical protein
MMANSRALAPQLKLYLQGKWDTSRAQILKELNISETESPALDDTLATLEQEGWVIKGFCKTHHVEEFDPGPAQHT